MLTETCDYDYEKSYKSILECTHLKNENLNDGFRRFLIISYMHRHIGDGNNLSLGIVMTIRLDF